MLLVKTWTQPGSKSDTNTDLWAQVVHANNKKEKHGRAEGLTSPASCFLWKLLWGRNNSCNRQNLILPPNMHTVQSSLHSQSESTCEYQILRIASCSLISAKRMTLRNQWLTTSSQFSGLGERRFLKRSKLFLEREEQILEAGKELKPLSQIACGERLSSLQLAHRENIASVYKLNAC